MARSSSVGRAVLRQGCLRHSDRSRHLRNGRDRDGASLAWSACRPVCTARTAWSSLPRRPARPPVPHQGSTSAPAQQAASAALARLPARTWPPSLPALPASVPRERSAREDSVPHVVPLRRADDATAALLDARPAAGTPRRRAPPRKPQATPVSVSCAGAARCHHPVDYLIGPCLALPCGLPAWAPVRCWTPRPA